MNEIEKVRTIDVITQEIRDLQDQTRRLVLGYAIEVGRRLVEAKDMLPHGEWGAWLAEKVNFKQRTAQRLITLYEEYGAEQIGIFGAEIKASALTNLSFTNALLLVAVPEEEREEFAAEVDAEHISSRELEQAIRERDEAKRQLQDMEADRDAAQKSVVDQSALTYELQKKLEEQRAENEQLNEEGAQLEKELQEMKNRPIEYAVQEPDPKAVKIEVDKALADAEAHYKAEREGLEKKLEGLEKKRDKLEKDLKAAEIKVVTAKNAGLGEAESLQAEVERLRKQLAMSDVSTTEFKTVFNSVQTDINRLLGIIEKAPADVAPKLRRALDALLDGVSEKLDAEKPKIYGPRLVEDDMEIPEDIDDDPEDEEDGDDDNEG